MTIDYLVFVNLLLLSRWVYLHHEQRLPARQAIVMALVQVSVAILLVVPGPAMVGVVFLLLMTHALGWWLDRTFDPAHGHRLITLVILFSIPGVVDTALGEWRMRAEMVGLLDAMNSWLPWINLQPWHQSLAPHLLLFGALLLANEANILVRAVFHLCRLYPDQTGRNRTQSAGIDERAFNAGRVIGFLERWLMFIVVLHSEDLSALAFIIAAKGLARMKQLENRDFAEYMLIGTLLSALGSLLVGLWIKPQLGG